MRLARGLFFVKLGPMADDSSDPSFRKAAAAYQSAGNLRRPPVAPQIVRLVEPPGHMPAQRPSAEAPPSAPEPVSGFPNDAPQAASPSAGVSLMITNAQKDALRHLGVSDTEIRDMTPAEAHRRLGLSGRG